jgi:hypothetical protein
MKHASNEPCNLDQSKRVVELSVFVHFVRNFALLRAALVAGPPRPWRDGSFVLVGCPVAGRVVASQELGLRRIGRANCRQLRLHVHPGPTPPGPWRRVRNGRHRRVRTGQSNESRRLVDLRASLLLRCLHGLSSRADSNADRLTGFRLWERILADNAEAEFVVAGRWEPPEDGASY